MAVLDTFYLLFKSQGADKVKKDEDNLSRSSSNLERNLKKTDFTANQLSDSFLNLGKKLAFTVASIASVGAVISGFKDAIDYAQGVDKASRALQVNADDLDSWGSAVSRIGGTAEGFQSSLKALSERLYTSGQNALKVLPQLADAFQKMNRTQAMRYGKTLGLDEYTIQLLQKGSKEVEKAIAHQKELGVVSKENAVIVREYGFAWHDTSQAFRIAFLDAAAHILPTLTKILNAFAHVAEFFQKHSNLIVGALLAIAAAVGVVAAGVIVAMGPILLMVALIGTVIAALALAYDDVMSFFEGNKSVTGGLVKAWQEAGEGIDSVFAGLWKMIKKVFGNIRELFAGLFDDITSAVSKVTSAYGKIKNLIPHHHVSVTPQLDASRGDSVIAKAQQALSLASNNQLVSAPPSSFLSSGDSSRSLSVNTGDITIETQATDAKGISESIHKTIMDQFRQTVNTFDDGVSI